MFGIPAYLLWLIAVVLLVILEASTMMLTCIWFAAGATAALLMALLSFGGFSVVSQFIFSFQT